MFVTDEFLLKFIGVFAALILLIIIWFKSRYSHWKNLGVEYNEPTIPFGNASDNIRRKISVGDWYANFYGQMRARQLRHAGAYLFHKPVYVPLDLELVKRIVQTDFVHFIDHGLGSYVNEKDDPLSAHVFSLRGERWRNLRVKLTPTFTSGKMKMMFPIIVKISEELGKTLERECSNDEAIELKDITARFTTDVIGNCAFGIDCNSLKDSKTEFRVQGKRVFTLTQRELIANFFGFIFPDVANFLSVRLLPKAAADFFWNVIKDTVEYRRQNGVKRNDALQLLMDMLRKDEVQDKDLLTFNELAAQAFVFFAGGFETSSTLMSFALLELSANQEVQNKLRDEVNAVLRNNNGELTYEAIHDMRYLDMVINESLRKYPPAPTLTRECTKDYTISDSDIVLRKGDIVVIPVKGIHYDPEYYPDPEKFDPTRFAEENRGKRHQFAYIPFGEGPRICLGLRFAMMQVKVGLALLIKDFRFKLNPRTEMPVKLDPGSFLTNAVGDLLTDVEKIE